jgi:hypothetical protein
VVQVKSGSSLNPALHLNGKSTVPSCTYLFPLRKTLHACNSKIAVRYSRFFISLCSKCSVKSRSQSNFAVNRIKTVLLKCSIRDQYWSDANVYKEETISGNVGHEFHVYFAKNKICAWRRSTRAKTRRHAYLLDYQLRHSSKSSTTRFRAAHIQPYRFKDFWSGAASFTKHFAGGLSHSDSPYPHRTTQIYNRATDKVNRKR